MKIKDQFHGGEIDLPKNEVPLEWWLERFRNWRANELNRSDWTQLPDTSANSAQWAAYRQALRDLPAVKDFANADVPTRPE